MNHDSYYGSATLYLDTDGNSTDDYVAVKQFSITDAETKVELHGTKDNTTSGTKIPIGTLVKGYIELDHLGEVHILSGDIEKRDGGIEVLRQNGSATGKYTLFWNDLSGLSQSPARYEPTDPLQSLESTGGTDSSGGVHSWDNPITYDECKEVVEGTSTTVQCLFDKVGHNNNYATHSWGDNRLIEDWTYDVAATTLFQQEERARVAEQEGSYFEYMFVDCTVSDAVFAEYIEYLERNGFSSSDIGQAYADRAKCGSTPEDPCEYNPSLSASDPECKPSSNDDLCELTYSGLLAYYGGDTALAYAKYYECNPSIDPPKSGARR
jgi:hypothetical protein